MNNIGITSILAATAAAGIVAAPIASAEAEAEPTVQTQTLGSQGKLVDGAVVQGWTVDNLQPSTDAIPYQVKGTLWEATANDQAIQGTVTPIVSNLNARAENGETYRALFGVATPQGVNPATLPQGEQTTGKVYFDVTGAEPDSVVYNAGGRDLLVWTEPPASSSSSSSSSTTYGSGDYSSEVPASAAPAEAPATETPEGTPAAPAATGTEAPLPQGSQGTPLPEGSQGTPLPEGVEGAPVPASVEGAPLPAGSQGTPLPPAQAAPAAVPPAPAAPGAPVPPAPAVAPAQVPAPASVEGAPLPAGSEVPAPAADEVPIPTTYTPAPTP